MSRGIVSWPEDERPRERLLSRGPQALADAKYLRPCGDPAHGADGRSDIGYLNV
jgi:hypothetical protein